MSSDASPRPRYILGHSDNEIDRLVLQARLVDPITERFLRDAGIGPGMRVLDVGTGAGDVAFLAATLVGERGEVVGVDNAAAAVEAATRRAVERAAGNVTFVHGEPDRIEFDRPFDAIVGRYVLQFQPDPAAMLRRLVPSLRPGGLVVFHELDWAGIVSRPSIPTFDRCCALIVETMRRQGTETSMGMKLYPTFLEAGLEPPTLRLEAIIAGGPNTALRLELTAAMLRSLAPEMERLGVAAAADLDLGTVGERMLAEAVERQSVIVAHHQIGAWSRVASG